MSGTPVWNNGGKQVHGSSRDAITKVFVFQSFPTPDVGPEDHVPLPIVLLSDSEQASEAKASFGRR
jgi:hypothetical protein